ncbi:hypothetical protein ACKWRH_06120 [Bradyrhizobium sp. Pa8]|uniref:hypothetical protein n=1 Tax=Bradyrhizobium sp. Pa8 TaxID=3386552 RepID=UPI00403F7C7F
MPSLKIHAAESNVAIWEKNIAMLSFVKTGQHSGDWLWCFNDLGVDASTPAAQETRANQRFVGDYLDKFGVDLPQNYE